MKRFIHLKNPTSQRLTNFYSLTKITWNEPKFCLFCTSSFNRHNQEISCHMESWKWQKYQFPPKTKKTTFYSASFITCFLSLLRVKSIHSPGYNITFRRFITHSFYSLNWHVIAKAVASFTCTSIYRLWLSPSLLPCTQNQFSLLSL